MPIKIPDSLPATATLESENIFVMTEYRAMHQDIRPLNLLILNLMPTKIVTETQLLRKLSNSPLQVKVELLHTLSHVSQNTDADHLSSFYTTFDQIKDRKFDGMIITGAPVENLDFTDVDYWDELCQIMDWTTTHVHSTLHICWGAQAGLFHHYGIPKYNLGKKLFGVFPHTVVRTQSPLFRGLTMCSISLTPATPKTGWRTSRRSRSLNCWPSLSRRAYSPSRVRTTAVSSSPATRSTTQRPWPTSISGM